MKKKIWVSLRRIKIHEFNRTLRYIRHSGETWPQVYARLTELQKDSVAKAVKAFSTPLLFYALLNSLGDTSQVSISVKDVTVAAPSGVVTMLASVTLMFVLMYMQSAFMVVTIRSNEAARVRLIGFSTIAFGFYNGNDDLGLVVPIAPYGALQPTHPVGGVLTSFLLAVIAFVLLPIVAIGVFLAVYQCEILLTPENGVLNYLGAFLGLIAILSTVAYLVLFNIPLPYKKNSTYIRWNFLNLISTNFPHPQIDEWIESDE